MQTTGANSEHKHSEIELFSALSKRIITQNSKDSALISRCNQSSVISTRNRLALNSNEPTTSTCKWNTSRLKM